MNQPDGDTHIIVIVRDEPGGLARITTALAEAEINIEMIDGRRAGGVRRHHPKHRRRR